MNLAPYVGDQIAGDVVLAGLPWSTAKVRLFVAGGPITQFTKFSDLTEATFVGYAATAWALATEGIDANGNFSYAGTPVLFTAGIGVTPQTVQGWFITDTAGSVLLAAGNFDNPITFTHPADALILKPLISYPLLNDQDAEFFAAP